MKINPGILFCVLFLFAFSGHATAKNNLKYTSSIFYFLENKGQVRDQNGCPRNDIQYSLRSPGMNVFIGGGQLHYQFSHINKQDFYVPTQLSFCEPALTESGSPKAAPCTMETYRLDVELLGANNGAIAERVEPQAYYENYYLPSCPAEGIRANSCKRIIYKNVYPDINWVIYINDGKLEHEFVVGPKGNASLIRLKYNGQTSIRMNDDGGITAVTPMGTVTEHAPVCYSADGNRIKSAFKLEHNILSYDVNDYRGALVIDPIVEWGTYYGVDTASSPCYSEAIDDSSFVYVTGMTYCATTGTIATTGSFQETMIGSPDAYLVKFDSSGNRIWGTYYGGIEGSWGVGVACDKWGNIFMAGTTASIGYISTTGAQQPSYGGGEWDGFLVSFKTDGTRNWATYVGGAGADEPSGVACDVLGHVYISGFTASSDGIATPGSFKPTGSGYSTFLVQYDTAGVRQWGTYYGGESSQFGGVCCTDGFSVYLTAWTESATGISSPGCYQPALNGPTDAYLVKFDVTGTRLWATYFGGERTEQTGGITCDDAGELYMLGTTYSDTGIATPGCAQPLRGGGADAFLAKIDKSTGYPLWSTYYGGPGDEITGLSRISTYANEIFITGYTLSGSGLASAGAWQTSYGGGDNDAFLADYDESGMQQWSTYLGGDGSDEGRAVVANAGGIYVCGRTTSSDKIATPGAFLSTGGSTSYDYQGFLVKFIYPPNVALSSTVTGKGSPTGLSLYPSPNKGSFTLNGILGINEGTVQISISDMAGRIVYHDEATINNSIINKQIRMSDNVPAGNYLLRAVSKEQVSVLKFVKE